MADRLAIFYCRIYFVPMIFHEIRWNTAIFCRLNPHFSYFPLPGWDNQKVPSSTESQGTTWFFWVFWRQLASARFVAGYGCWCIPRFQRYWGAWNRRPTSPFLQIMDRLQRRHHNINEKMVRIGVTIPMAELFRWIFPNYRLCAHEHVEMISLKSQIKAILQSIPEVTATIVPRRNLRDPQILD